MKPENPEEGSNMFTFKKEKEEAMSEEKKKMAQELSDVIGNLEEADLYYEEIEDSVELSPAEKLAYNIADHLAAVTAERFSDMIDGMDMDIAKQIVGRLQQSDAESVAMLLRVSASFARIGAVSGKILDLFQKVRQTDDPLTDMDRLEARVRRQQRPGGEHRRQTRADLCAF